MLASMFLRVACAVLCCVTQSCPTLCNPMDCSPSGSSVHGDFPGKHTRMYCHALLQGIFPNQELKPSLRAFNSLPSEPAAKPKNAEVGGLSLLQRNFQTQESNQSLLYCRRILYQLSLPENPRNSISFCKYSECKYYTKILFLNNFLK